MTNWNSLLKDTIPSPCFERPFVCEGLPSDSPVIVVGENPATPLTVDWWSFWRANTGFDYQTFLDTYLEERSKIGKGVSKTRRRLNRFRANGISCVETNAFRNEKPDGAGQGAPNFDILNLLIANMPSLRAIVAHGKIAQEYIAQASIPSDISQYRTRHFRMESYKTIDDICVDIRNDA